MERRTDEQTRRLAAHVFVCVNERDAFWSPVGVSATDCLGLCSEGGTAITIQPRNEWYAEVRPEDVPDLLADAFGPDADRVARPE